MRNYFVVPNTTRHKEIHEVEFEVINIDIQLHWRPQSSGHTQSRHLEMLPCFCPWLVELSLKIEMNFQMKVKDMQTMHS